MAPHSNTLAWKIPWMEEPCRLQSIGSLRVGHDWSDLAVAVAVKKKKKKRLSVKVKQSSTEGFGIICSNFQVKQASANVTNSKMVRYCSEGKYHMQLENNLRI